MNLIQAPFINAAMVHMYHDNVLNYSGAQSTEVLALVWKVA